MSVETRDRTQKQIRQIIIDSLRETFRANSSIYKCSEMADKILSIPGLAIVDWETIIYKCPKCNSEYDYQPDYRCCIECETYLDAYLKQAW